MMKVSKKAVIQTAFLVPGAGLEPARCRHRRILSPVRLPVPPPGQLVSRVRLELTTL